MAFRKGDTVAIQGNVKYNLDAGDQLLAVEIDGQHQVLWVDYKTAKTVSQSFEVGDDVEWPQDDGINAGTVLAISNGHAWIDLNNGDYCTRLLTTISRAGHSDE